MRTEMTFEEAWEYNDSRYDKEEIAADENRRQKEIECALDNWNYCMDIYPRRKERVMEELVKVLKDGDTVESLDIRFESIEDFVKRAGDKLKFTAWSKNWVYVCGVYDGSLWVKAVSRNPSDYLITPIGGG